MEPIIDALQLTWQGYGVSEYVLYVVAAAALVGAYWSWQRTALAVWGVLYVWSMVALLGGQYFDVNEGLNALWLCTYALLGFFLLGYFIYSNLKD